jgi:uncharacterized membrane protein
VADPELRETAPDDPGHGGEGPAVRGERRWPMALAVLVAAAMQFALPDRHVLKPTFLFPTIEVLLLVVLMIGDPGRIDRRSPLLRRLTLLLVAAMSIDNLAAVVELVGDIIRNDKQETGTVLLATGGAIWLTNVIAFSLWYWLLDRGGPAERANQAGIAPAFVFAEMVSPEFVRDDWTPEYIDYLWLAFTNATAFSPTDTMPITHWAKMLMFLQAATSLVIAVMIIARAVNILN